MEDPRFLTIHTIFTLPWSNLNRDEAGNPKSLFQGGVQRAQLSSQSIKRGIRNLYESTSDRKTKRTRSFIETVADAAMEVAGSDEEELALKTSIDLIGGLTTKIEEKKLKSLTRQYMTKRHSEGEKAKKAEKDLEKLASIWLSSEEEATAIQSVAAVLKGENKKAAPFLEKGQTASLSVAAFGRMFAVQTKNNVEAAIAVGPAVSTHRATVDTDYFSTVDDDPSTFAFVGSGSSFLGMAAFTNGVFYRTVTIDRYQLRKNWTEIESPDAHKLLTIMVDALIYGLPKGKKNSTAPYIMPALVFAEEQEHRIAYNFEQPVELDEKSGGYELPTIHRFQEQIAAARSFDPDNFGPLQFVTGTQADKFDTSVLSVSGDDSSPASGTKSDMSERIVRWILP